MERCQDHNRPSELVCLKCKVKVCPHCALFGSHKGHDVREMSEVHALLKENSDLVAQVIKDVEKS